jgi:DNA-binding GntR family transcriptional regulator
MPIPDLQLSHEGRLGDELYEALRAAILDGTLRADERLGEESIAAAAAVSRTPVREALHKLAVDGLVQVSKRGVVVGSFSLSELGDLCSVRVTLEAMAAGLAAVSMTDLELATLQGIHLEYRDATARTNVVRLVGVNHAFHELIWQGSRNRYLATELRVLTSQIDRLQETTLAVRARRAQAAKEHDMILQAVLDRDAAKAESVSRQHFRQAMALRLGESRLAMNGQGGAGRAGRRRARATRNT